MSPDAKHSYVFSITSLGVIFYHQLNEPQPKLRGEECKELRNESYINMTRGRKICAFIEHYCLIPEGAQVGQPIKLMKFQRKFILDVFDNPHGTSRAYLSVAGKNGKSALITAILLAHLVGPEARQNSQIISGARSRDQASLVFKLAEKMIELLYSLSKIVRIVKSQKMLIGVICNVKYKVIIADHTAAHGSCALLSWTKSGKYATPTIPDYEENFGES